MQSVSSRILTRVAVSISYDDNHYTTGTSTNQVTGPGRYSVIRNSSDANAVSLLNVLILQDKLLISYHKELYKKKTTTKKRQK